MENTIEATARLRNFRGSARKARLLLDLIRGKDVNVAKNLLQFSTKRMAKDIYKLLNSAVANATSVGEKLDLENLYIQTAFADGGAIMKRNMPRAQGTATLIKKRLCHITITVANKK